MPFREYEAKVLIEDDVALINIFHKIGATLIRSVLQRDRYYDLNYYLMKKDELLRIRIEETEDTHSFHAGEFSWKSGRQGDQYEVREDISIPLNSPETVSLLDNILKRLGLRNLAILTKHRERWRLDNVEFEFDRNIEAEAINRPKKRIGSFLQATIETESEFSPEEMETLLWNSLEQLGFERNDLRWDSYIEIYLDLLNERDTPAIQKKRDL